MGLNRRVSNSEAHRLGKVTGAGTCLLGFVEVETKW